MEIAYTPSDWGMMIRALQFMAMEPGEHDRVVAHIRAQVKPPSHAPVSVTFAAKDAQVLAMAAVYAFPPGMVVRTPERGY